MTSTTSPKIIVVIATQTVRKTLMQCLDSVAKQSYPHIECHHWWLYRRLSSLIDLSIAIVIRACFWHALFLCSARSHLIRSALD